MKYPIVNAICKMRRERLIALSIFASLVLTVIIVSMVELLLRGTVTWDYLLTGALTSPLVTLLVVPIIIKYSKVFLESEANAAVLAVAAEGIAVVDIETKKIIYVNPSYSELYGYTQDEALHLGVEQLHPPETISRVVGVFERQSRGEQIVEKDIACLRKDGSVFFADVRAKPTIINGRNVLVGLFTDVTARKQTEEALRESETWYRTLFEQASDIMFTLEIVPHRSPVIRSVNPAALRALGYSSEELIGASVDKLEPGVSAAVIRQRQMQASESGMVAFEARHMRKDGSFFDAEVRACEFLTEGKRVGIAVARDISERKNAERILRDAKESAEKANHAKDLFLSTLSHELRTPLTAILGWAQMLKSGRLDPSKAKTGFQTIEEAAQAQNQLISDLLDVSALPGNEWVEI